MTTVDLKPELQKLLKAYKKVTGLTMKHFVADAIWEKIGRLPADQKTKISSLAKKL